MNLDIVKKHEGCKLTAYQCSANVWTIGYGNTFYEDGSPVKKGDKITQERAEELLKLIVDQFAVVMSYLLKQEINANQYSALMSIAYNIGMRYFAKSTLLKKVNYNPNDPAIADEFKKWNKAKGVVLPGLVKRREAEAKLYFTKP